MQAASGLHFREQAEVEDTSRVLVNIGLGFHAELSRSEATAAAHARCVRVGSLANIQGVIPNPL